MTSESKLVLFSRPIHLKYLLEQGYGITITAIHIYFTDKLISDGNCITYEIRVGIGDDSYKSIPLSSIQRTLGFVPAFALSSMKAISGCWYLDDTSNIKHIPLSERALRNIENSAEFLPKVESIFIDPLYDVVKQTCANFGIVLSDDMRFGEYVIRVKTTLVPIGESHVINVDIKKYRDAKHGELISIGTFVVFRRMSSTMKEALAILSRCDRCGKPFIRNWCYGNVCEDCV